MELVELTNIEQNGNQFEKLENALKDKYDMIIAEK